MYTFWHVGPGLTSLALDKNEDNVKSGNEPKIEDNVKNTECLKNEETPKNANLDLPIFEKKDPIPKLGIHVNRYNKLPKRF